MSSQIRAPELMSPAGYWPELRAAIEAGADAVYFGLKHFSARAKVGFGLEELPDVMNTLHSRFVKGFVTFNTLVFDEELELAVSAIQAVAAAGCDALIVQDVGVAQLVRSVAPELEIHGSTQMSITSAQGAELAKQFGCSRVVLGRELSLKDIRKIASQTDVELETFVHGALCVSYSGQCFSSEAWGGRSANRGKCAQACRLSYDLIVDDELTEVGPYRYLLSPGDLYALEQIPELIDMGVSCLKIEGRYKDAEYVALTTRAYRQAIDAAMEQREVDADKHRDELEQIYSRGLGPYFISGVDHQNVVEGRAPRHRGIKIGRVQRVGADFVDVELEKEVFPGDGIVFDAADWRSPDEPEEGGNIYEVITLDANLAKLKFGFGDLDFQRIRVNDLVWRTRSPRTEKSVKSLVQATKPVYTRPIDLQLNAQIGEPLRLTARLDLPHWHQDFEVHVTSEQVLEAAKSSPADPDAIHSQLSRLGGTPFHLGSLELQVDFNAFLPASLLNQLRREVIEKLIRQNASPVDSSKIQVRSPDIPARLRNSLQGSDQDAGLLRSGTRRHLHLLVRTPEQLDAALESAADSITLDYLELYGLRSSVEKIRKAGGNPRVASPRILKPSEQNVIRFLLSLECPIVVRSGGLLKDLIGETVRPQLIGDFSLNLTNEISAMSYLDLGLDFLTPGYDLNARQIQNLAGKVPAEKIEVIVYSHLPVFHTEHCLFCRFLSSGTDNTNCGHPCEKHRVAIRDKQGRHHPVMADVGCRNTVFGAEAQTDPKSLAEWLSAGIQHFRLEFVHQTPAQVLGIAQAFGDFLSGQLDSDALQRILDRHSPQKTTPGSLFVPEQSDLIQLS